MRRPIASYEVGFLARFLVRWSERINRHLGLVGPTYPGWKQQQQHPGGEGAEEDGGEVEAEDRWQEAMKWMRKKGYR